MPGSFYSDSLTPDSRAGGSMTSAGAPSQPKNSGLGGGYDPGPSYSPATPVANPNSWASQLTARPQSWTGQFIGAARTAMAPNAGTTGVSQYSSPLGGVQSIVDTMYGPQQTILGQQLARQYDQLGMVGEDVNYRQGALTRDNALANQLLGLDRQALGIDAGLIGTQQQNLGKLKGILQKQFGLNDRDLATTLRQLGWDESQAKDMAKRKNWDLRSDLTKRGAFNTVANERGTGRIQTDLAFQLLGIGTQKDKAKLGWEGTRYGLQEKGIGYDNQAAQLGANLGKIGLDVKRLGINEQQLANGLQDGLRQIGLDGYMSINNLFDAIGGTNQQQSQLATTILGEMLAFSNLPPDVLKQLQDALGLGGGTGKKQTSTLPGGRLPA